MYSTLLITRSNRKSCVAIAANILENAGIFFRGAKANGFQSLPIDLEASETAKDKELQLKRICTVLALPVCLMYCLQLLRDVSCKHLLLTVCLRTGYRGTTPC